MLSKKQTQAVLVTGANSGIGLATAEYLVSRGFYVYAAARNTDTLKDVSKNQNILPVKLDVTDTKDVISVKKIIEKRGTGLFGLVNNAGIAKVGPLMDVNVEDMRAQFEVNLFGVHQITQALFPLLLEAKGRIVMMSSDSGFFATPFVGLYCSSKFALEGYADSLRREVLNHGVKIVLIEPGRVRTPIWQKSEKEIKSKKLTPSVFWKEAMAVGKYALQKGKSSGLPPLEVAKTVYHVLTAKNPKLRYIVAENKYEYQLIKILPAWYVDKLVTNKVKKAVRMSARKK